VRNPPPLRNRREFQRVLAAGRRGHRDGILAVALRGPDPKAPVRLGLAVHCDGAVARNRAKRRLRAAFRELELRPGYEVVVRADERVLSTGYEHLLGDLIAALTEAMRGSR
jgi:ribonuclease P protein component